MTENDKQSPFSQQKKRSVAAALFKVYEWLTLPFAIYFLLHPTKTHPSHRLSYVQRMALGFRLHRNTRRIWTGTSSRAHMAMAQKLLSLPKSFEGVVVECGCFRGGSTANLSIICDLVGRDLIVYDSFEGMPEHAQGDRYSSPELKGFLAAPLEGVRSHVEQYGVIERCTFVKGYFEDTLPGHEGKIAAIFLDVDYQASLFTCVRNLWPSLHERGFVFIDEYVLCDYCALFYSEKFWRKYFDRSPPGLLGAGSGLPLGFFYTGPWGQNAPTENPASIAYTRKHFSGVWEFYPDED